MKNKFNSLLWTYRHLKPAYKQLVNLSVNLLAFLILALLIDPALVLGGMGYLVCGILGTGVGNFYDSSAYQEEGSNIWYFQFINKTTDAVVSFGGAIAFVNVTNAGSGYTSAPTVTISAPAAGTQATGTAHVAGGKVVEVRLTNIGAGYVAGDNVTVTFSGGAGAGAAATAYLADGWHLGPGRQENSIEVGQEETEVLGEDKQPFTTVKQPAKGDLILKLLQNDIITMRAFYKYMSTHDCRIFIYEGPSRGNDFKGYIFIGKVRFPNRLSWKKGTGVDYSLMPKILQNKSAISITNSTDLPVANLVGVYSLAAKEIASMNEETIEPTI